MKIEKKHAVTLSNYIGEYLEAGYYPIDDEVDESAMISHILGFIVYHDEDPDSKGWAEQWAEKRELPKVKKTARIDLTQDHSRSILSMMEDSLGRDIEETAEIKSLKRYLEKHYD